MDSQNYQDYVEEIDVQRYWLVLKRRWVPAALVLVACSVAGAILYTSSKGDPIFFASGKLILRTDVSTSLTGVGTEIAGLESIGRSDPFENQANIVDSLPVLQDVVEELDLRDAQGNLWSANSLRPGLSVARQGTTNILKVDYFAPEPELAAAVANQIMNSYVERSIALNRSQATAAREFVEEQIPESKENLDQAAEALRQFQIQNQIVNLEGEAGAAVGLRANLETQISDAQINLARVSTQIRELRQRLEIPLAEAQQYNALSESEGVQSVLTSLQEVQVALASERSRYTEEHPTIRNLKRQEASLEALLRERIGEAVSPNEAVVPSSEVDNNELQMSSLNRQLTRELAEAEVLRLSLIAQLRELEETRVDVFRRSANFPTLAKQLRDLQQNLEITQTTYERLLGRLEESKLAESKVVATADILEYARVPGDPVASGNSKLLIGVAGGSIFLMIAVAFILDLVDKSIKTVKDGEALLGYTLLGLIPLFEVSGSDRQGTEEFVGERSPRIVASSQTQPMAAAAYQMLQANLKFISSDTSQRAITITSSVAQEGKSEVCANLAMTIAQAGKRVLLVDADMRSPSQHHLWNVINQIGLSHVLVGEGEFSDALHQVANNLTLLTAGVTPPNPLALVDSERMGELVQSLLAEYDYVLFDTPPLVGAADAAMLGKVSDGVLLVLRPRHVDSASALSAKALLDRSGAQVMGMVANAVNIHDEHDDYVSQIKAGAYPYAQNAPAEKKRDRPLIPLKLSGRDDVGEDPFK